METQSSLSFESCLNLIPASFDDKKKNPLTHISWKFKTHSDMNCADWHAPLSMRLPNETHRVEVALQNHSHVGLDAGALLPASAG